MPSRRLIAAPLVAFVAASLVAAVVQAGERTRTGVLAPTVDREIPAAVADELARIDAVSAAEDRCSDYVDCTHARIGDRVRRAARSIGGWPPSDRFRESRHAIRQALLARALVLDQQQMLAIDGHTSPDEARRLDQLRDAWIVAARHALDAQLAAGLIDVDTHGRGVLALADDDDDAPGAR